MTFVFIDRRRLCVYCAWLLAYGAPRDQLITFTCRRILSRVLRGGTSFLKYRIRINYGGKRTDAVWQKSLHSQDTQFNRVRSSSDQLKPEAAEIVFLPSSLDSVYSWPFLLEWATTFVRRTIDNFRQPNGDTSAASIEASAHQSVRVQKKRVGPYHRDRARLNRSLYYICMGHHVLMYIQENSGDASRKEEERR